MVVSMPPHPMLPPELLAVPFRGSEAISRGLLTRAQLRSRCWRRLLHDIYCHAGLADSPDLRGAALGLVVPPGAALSGPYAAWLHGADVLRAHDRLELTAPPSSGLSRAGKAVRESRLTDDDTVVVGGVRVTSPLRTAFDLGRRKDLTECVVALDAMTHAGLVGLDELAAYAESHRRWRGVPNLRTAVGLAEPKTESPMESRLRMVIVLGDLPRPQVQIEVRESGLLVARLDMGYEELQIGIEYDGRDFHAGDARAGDDIRDNSLGVRDWRILRYGAWHVFRQPDIIRYEVGRLRQLRRGRS